NRNLEINISVIPLKDLKGNYKINVSLAESHIVDSQMLSDGSTSEDYEFENALRDMITPWDGQSLGTDLKENNIIFKTYSYTLPQDENLWKPENMKVISFVTGGEESDLRPVINASESNIIN
ncbi:MAG TPA: Omp28-related outer membrane protein, partial [Saprospiraceae bacterium]|nr:Omp28-related outer membrane protein [Saprospiraceae bacterium]